MLAGAIAGLGRPGIDVPLVFVASLGFLFFVAVQSGWRRALAFGAGWGAGLFPIITLGTLSWGARVPVALTWIGCAMYSVPMALWARWAGRRFASIPLFVTTAAACALAMFGADAVGYPVLGTTLSLVVRIPVLLGGARIVGSDVLEGVITAGVLLAARELAIERPTWKESARRSAVWLGATAGALLVLSGLARATAAASLEEVRVGVPQVDADVSYYESRMVAPAVVAAFAEKMQRLLAELRDVDLVVLTESFDGRFGLQIPAVRDAWEGYAAARHQAVLFTSYVVSGDGWKANAVAGFDGQGRWVGMHRKVDLAPYGERHLAAGRDYAPLPVLSGASVGSLVCEESVVPWGARAEASAGAGLLAVSTSDETFGTSVAVFEHLALAQLRAIEVGRAVVWASNAGPSTLVDRWGALDGAAPFDVPAAARFTAPIFGDRTPYVRTAAAWPPLCALILAVGLVFGLLRSARGGDVASRAHRRRTVAEWLRDVALGLAMMASAVSAWLLAPAFVAAARGDSARATQALTDPFTRQAGLAMRDPFARFRTPESQSAWGAAGYYLTYYGAESRPIDPSLAPGPTTLDEMRELLASDLPSRTIPLRADAFPRVATLVQLREGGTFGVATRPSGEGLANLFLPAAGTTRTVAIADLLGAIRGEGLVATPIQCEPGRGCRIGE